MMCSFVFQLSVFKQYESVLHPKTLSSPTSCDSNTSHGMKSGGQGDVEEITAL